MDDREKQEEKNKRIGWLTSVGVQLVLLVLFYFIIAWKEPFPPIPEYGIELGFTTSAGAESSSSSPVETPVENESESTETNQEVEEVDNTTDNESEVETIEEKEVEETTDQSVQQPIEESAVEEQVESMVEEVQDVPVTEDQETVEQATAEEETPQVDNRAVIPSSSSSSQSENERDAEGQGESEEEKEIDQRAIYGSQGPNTGSNEGASLALAGWIWDFKPEPDDQSDQSGKIVYKIVVDQDGYLVKIETVTSTVSPAVERKYRQAVEKLTFSKTAEYKTANQSSGTITFIIKSK